LAEKDKVTERTIRRDARFAEALDVLADILGTEFRSDVLAGTSGLSRKDIVALSEMSRAEVLAVADDRKAMRAAAKEWRARADELEDEPGPEEVAVPDREASAGLPTDEAEHLRTTVATYRETMERIVEVCGTDGAGVEGLRRLLDEVAMLAQEAMAAEHEDAAPEETA